jgi:hypothetical protein
VTTILPMSILAVAVATGLVVLIAYGNRIRRINKVFAAVAERHGGRLQRAGFWRHPRIRFSYEGQTVEVATEAADGVAEVVHTVFRCTWPDATLFLEVHPTRFYTGVVRLLGGRDVLTGSRGFDRQYSARGNDPERVRGTLSAGVQNRINQLRQLTPAEDFHLTIGNGLLTIWKRGVLLEPARLSRFTHLSLELIDQAMLTNMAGIEIVSEQAAPLRGEATCRVCGDPIGADIVYCRLCHTPHHHECWLYNGSCSIYGCGEKRYWTGQRAVRRLAAPSRGPESGG